MECIHASKPFFANSHRALNSVHDVSQRLPQSREVEGQRIRRYLVPAAGEYICHIRRIINGDDIDLKIGLGKLGFGFHCNAEPAWDGHFAIDSSHQHPRH